MTLRVRHPEFTIDAAGSIAAAEEIACRRRPYKLLVLDYGLPDAVGFSGFFRMHHILGETPIAILSSEVEPSIISTARALGAAGMLLKTEPLDELADHIDLLLQGGHIFPQDVAISDGMRDLKARLKTLSAAKMRVLIALSAGSLNKQIASELDVSEATIKAHLTAIFRKLGVASRLQAMLATRTLFESSRAN